MPAPITITCRLAVAGHTYYSLRRDGAEEQRLRQTVTVLVDTVLKGIKTASQQAIQRSHVCDPPMVNPQPRLVLLTSLAPGTDQLAADRAVTAQFELGVVLPGTLEAYAEALPDDSVGELRRFCDLARQPSPVGTGTVLELDEVVPAEATDAAEEIRQNAYRVAGHVVLQNADFLLAVYDDDKQRRVNSGGTAEMVRRARETGVPVFWIHPRKGTIRIGAAQAPELPATDTGAIETAVAKLVCAELSLVAHGSEPTAQSPHHHEAEDKHQQQKEERALQRFFDEQPLEERHWFWKLLIAIWNFVDGWFVLPREPARQSQPVDSPRWKSAKETVQKARAQVDAAAASIEYDLGQIRNVIDGFSIHYTGLHRASMLLMYIFGVFAVVFAGCASVTHVHHDEEHATEHAVETHHTADQISASHVFCGLELLCLTAGLGLYLLNRAGNWQERATDYRLLTERLRHAAALSILGRATWQYAYEPLPAHYSEHHPRGGWVDRVYRALVREAVMPIGSRDLGQNRRAYPRACRRRFLKKYIGEQKRYHRRNAGKLHRQHVAVEVISYVALAFTFLICLSHFVISNPALTVLSTTLPAVIAACHGLAAHFHLQRVLQRSEAMERHLETQYASAPRLTVGNTSHVLAEWSEGVAIRMLQEADEWRVVFRLLNVPTPG